MEKKERKQIEMQKRREVDNNANKKKIEINNNE